MDGIDTIFFIAKFQVPRYQIKVVKYGRIVVFCCPKKEDPYKVQLTLGVNLIFYSGDVRTPTADITTAKLIINSTISMPGARYMCCDLENFFLVTPLSQYEYIKLPIDILPE